MAMLLVQDFILSVAQITVDCAWSFKKVACSTSHISCVLIHWKLLEKISLHINFPGISQKHTASPSSSVDPGIVVFFQEVSPLYQ